MTHFNHCPNCGRLPESGLFSSGVMKIYECRCGTLYCRGLRCGGSRCPNCGSRERKEAGICHRR